MPKLMTLIKNVMLRRRDRGVWATENFVMKKLLAALVVLFIFASCQKDNSNYYVKEIIRLENQVMKAEYERDIYKAKLNKYEASDYIVLPDTTVQMSMSSIKAFVRFYPN